MLMTLAAAAADGSMETVGLESSPKKQMGVLTLPKFSGTKTFGDDPQLMTWPAASNEFGSPPCGKSKPASLASGCLRCLPLLRPAIGSSRSPRQIWSPSPKTAGMQYQRLHAVTGGIFDCPLRLTSPSPSLKSLSKNGNITSFALTDHQKKPALLSVQGQSAFHSDAPRQVGDHSDSFSSEDSCQWTAQFPQALPVVTLSTRTEKLALEPHGLEVPARSQVDKFGRSLNSPALATKYREIAEVATSARLSNRDQTRAWTTRFRQLEALEPRTKKTREFGI